tara:strand:+ start:406 stop:2379 length:1974 start_codon:yes stop_codon:yes gene_type:complete
MGVAFSNNWENILDKLESVVKTEFGATLKTYRGLDNITEGNQYLRIAPVGSELVDYSGNLEIRRFSLNLFLYFKVINAKKTNTDQVMRVLSRLETIIGNNITMTLSDNTQAYNCRIESTEIDTSNSEEYLINLEYKCLHQNSSLTPAVTITASQVADGATSSDSALSLTFTLNRDSDNFVVGDIDVTNGSLSSFSGSGSVYTATFTPSAQGATTIKVLADKFTGIGATGGNTASDIFNWTYIPKFVSTWNTEAGDSGNKTITLPLVSSGSYNFTVDWGDGSSDTITAYDQVLSGESVAVTHTYSSVETNITVTIDGTITGWQFNNGGHKLKLLTISNWGNLNISTNSAFYGCTNLAVSASNAPTISSTNLTNTFRQCTSITQIGGALNTSSVVNFTSMFHNCSSFNQSLSDWTFATSGDVNCTLMFNGCTSFNSALAWGSKTVRFTNLSNIFQSCSAFNQDVSSWDVSNVTNLTSTFAFCTVFNNGGTALNWDTGSVTNMNATFSNARAFNQSIAGWDTSNVTNMASMFDNARNYNQAMATSGDSWNTGEVTNMASMFKKAHDFDQDISSWDIRKVANFSSFMNDKTTTNGVLSTTNYNKLLHHWHNQDPIDNLSFDASDADPDSFSGEVDGITARAALVLATGDGGDGWSIQDADT